MLNGHTPEAARGPECGAFAGLLPLVGEETLSEAEVRRVRAHLATCASCQQDYAAYRRIEANLRYHFGGLPSLRFSPEDMMAFLDDIPPSEEGSNSAAAPPRSPQRRRRRVVSLVSLVAAVLVIAVVTVLVGRNFLPNTSGATHQVASSPTPTLGPPVPETPYVPGSNDALGGIQMLSSTEGWAVGDTLAPLPAVGSTALLILHYHDGQWLRMAAPSFAQLGVSDANLYSISMTSANEGWAVGNGDLYDLAGGSAFILHYSGGRWSLYGSLMRETTLSQVQMLSPTNGWIVGGGNIDFAGQQTSVILHYDGKRWAAVPAPPAFVLGGLDMVSATDGWATGRGMILHYDGLRWTIFQQAPLISTISMGSASDGWAVGGALNGVQGSLFWHYDGKQWKQAQTIASSNPVVSFFVNGLSMNSATDGWAIGIENTSTSPSESSTQLYLRYSQGHWTQVQGPQVGFLEAVTMLSADDGWAVGIGGLILHYQHGAWSQYKS